MIGGMSSNGETIAAEAFPLSGSHLIAVARPHQPWFDRRYEMAAYWIFAAYAVAVVLLAGGQDVIWAAWAAPAYAIAAVAVTWSRSWAVAALTAVFAVAVPLLVMMAQGGELAAGMTVIDRSAALLIRDGTPYLPSGQLSSWLAYNPYLPAMALFGLPSAVGLQGAPGDPRVWLVLVTVAGIAAALSLGVPHSVKDCVGCRRTLLRSIAFATACPAVALNLAVTTTDPPVLALMLLAIALLNFPERLWPAAMALGLACAMKPTAWLAIPVLAAMLRYRDGTREAVRFTAISVAVFLVITLPVMLADPVAMAQNTVLFPLGLTAHLTPAQSLTPGDLLARTGPVGHDLSVGLLIVVGIAVAVLLLIRPPRSPRAAAWWLAIGLAFMFTLGPDERFGYFIYPLGLVGWLLLTRPAKPVPDTVPAELKNRTAAGR
jgi:Glycosyltransferase family 87